jgi:hypothetical protein
MSAGAQNVRTISDIRSSIPEPITTFASVQAWRAATASRSSTDSGSPYHEV